MGSISPSAHHSSPWHSPVPYLFAGLAASLSLIAFALVLLACSYRNDRRYDRGGGNLESDGGNEAKISPETPPEKDNYDEKVLVIMAGNQNPSFLATPVCVNASSSAVETAGNSRSEGNEAADNSEKLIEDYDREVSNESTKMSGVIYQSNYLYLSSIFQIFNNSIQRRIN